MDILVVVSTYVIASVLRKCEEEGLDRAWGAVHRFLEERRQLEVGRSAPEALQAWLREEPGLEALMREVQEHSSSLNRVDLVRQVVEGAQILWIDDHPEHNVWERRLFQAMGARITTAETTRTALVCGEVQRFDVVISDIDRGSSQTEGLDSLRGVASLAPVVFYVGAAEPELGVPPGAFGICDVPGELVHLVLDVLERHRL